MQEAGHDEVFEVESIIGKSTDEVTGMVQYHVKWKGFEEATWEPSDNLVDCAHLVDFYEHSLQKQHVPLLEHVQASLASAPELHVNNGSDTVKPLEEESTDDNTLRGLLMKRKAEGTMVEPGALQALEPMLGKRMKHSKAMMIDGMAAKMKKQHAMGDMAQSEEAIDHVKTSAPLNLRYANQAAQVAFNIHNGLNQ